MKVLMIGWEFPPHNSGGLGVACRGLARALVGQNTDLIFVLPKKFTVDDTLINMLFADIPSVRIRKIDTLLSPYVTSEEYEAYRRAHPNDIYADTLFEEVARYACAMTDIANTEHFDIIHAHDWLSYPAAMEAKQVSGKPLILHVHATAHDMSGGNPDQRIYDIERKAMEVADCVIAVSQFTKDIISFHYGIPPEKIQVVHNGIDANDFTEDDDPLHRLLLKKSGQKMVLFVGRVTLMKGPDYFLRAAQIVLKYEPETIFIITGSGDMEWQIIRLAAELGISDKVLFTGFVRGEELKKLYRSADLFVLPSVSEPFGLAPLESIMSGTPVLISKQSGISEVITGALKVDFWDIEEMANKIICVLRYPLMSKQMHEHGKKEAKTITWDKAAQKCIEIYKKFT